MGDAIPRLVIAGLSGDAGKTLVSLSFLSALKRRGVQAAVFKKGPDYIDAAWLGQVSGSQCRNLDTYMVPQRRVRRSFARNARHASLALIEGNRGLFDGKDLAGTHSTAELAKMLQSPVILVVNTAKTTRTTAALVSGCKAFDSQVEIAGIVLNRVAGHRHEQIVTRSIEKFCGLPVLGAIPKLGGGQVLVPNRHLGLIPPTEFDSMTAFEEALGGIGDAYLNIDGLLDLARKAEPLEWTEAETFEMESAVTHDVRIGYFKDSVFTFYYPENLEALASAGAHLVPISSLETPVLPPVDALYIGGGFPETHAEALGRNQSLMASVKTASELGLPIYAECGGLIYLAKSISWEGRDVPMSGVFPIQLDMSQKPAGHGYTEARVDCPNPFFPVGTKILGHEFHYSGPKKFEEVEASCMEMEKGAGLGNKRDGLISHNTLACYSHIHADGVDTWAPSFVARAIEHKNRARGEGNNGLD